MGKIGRSRNSTANRNLGAPYRRGPSRGFGLDELPNDNPPAVLAARERLGLASDTECVPSSSARIPNQTEASSSVQDRSHKFVLDDSKLVTHAGETLTRVRKGSPWIPDPTERPKRGSLRLAVQIVQSQEMLEQTDRVYDALVFAPGTSSSKCSTFSTWDRLCKEQGVPTLPVCPEVMRRNTAILRSAGYRAINSFLQEIKDRHVRCDFPWTASLQIAFQDCKRVADRAKGVASKSAEVRPEWWSQLISQKGCDPEAGMCHSDGPRGGVVVMGSWLRLPLERS